MQSICNIYMYNVIFYVYLFCFKFILDLLTKKCVVYKLMKIYRQINMINIID